MTGGVRFLTLTPFKSNFLKRACKHAKDFEFLALSHQWRMISLHDRRHKGWPLSCPPFGRGEGVAGKGRGELVGGAGPGGGGGGGDVHPSAQLRGIGERCKVPQPTKEAPSAVPI